MGSWQIELVKDLEMKASWIEGGPSMKKRGHTQSLREEGHVKREAGTRALKLRDKECQDCQSHWRPERRKDSSQSPDRAWPCPCCDFRLPEL